MIKYRVGKSRFTLASQQEFILVLLINVLFICIIFNMNNNNLLFSTPVQEEKNGFLLFGLLQLEKLFRVLL